MASQYDSMNDRTQLVATIAGTADFLNTYQYDADQRLTQLVQQGQNGGNSVPTSGADLYYNALGQITKIFRTSFFGVGPQPDIATSNLSYDAGNRLTQIAYTDNGGTAIDAYSWAYDAANRVTSMTTTTDGTATYSYDNTNQVTGASYTGTGQPANETYSYDSNGNRTNTGYSTGTNNLLTSDGTFNYTYDAEGNRITRTRISNSPANDYKTTYTWDYRDRLTDVYFYNNSNTLTKHVHYTYDAFDHRISKSVDSTGSGSYDRAEYYVYDGNSVVGDFIDPDGAGPQPVALATRYLNGPSNAAATDQVFAQEDASTGNVLWLLSDNLGTTRDIVNDSSALVAHEVYNSFGQLVSGPTNVTSFLYTGQMWDADVGLQYNWHRWYDPAVGRWISEDPMAFMAGDPNICRYVGNNPLSYIDPSGLITSPVPNNPPLPPFNPLQLAPPFTITLPPGFYQQMMMQAYNLVYSPQIATFVPPYSPLALQSFQQQTTSNVALQMSQAVMNTTLAQVSAALAAKQAEINALAAKLAQATLQKQEQLAALLASNYKNSLQQAILLAYAKKAMRDAIMMQQELKMKKEMDENAKKAMENLKLLFPKP